jgi:hypothetical protein
VAMNKPKAFPKMVIMNLDKNPMSYIYV